MLNNSTTPNIAAINMSLGGAFHKPIFGPPNLDTRNPRFGSVSRIGCERIDIRGEIINELRHAGIATIISAGNAGYSDAVAFPGCISQAITVGHTTENNDMVDQFSNTASMVDILAPGSHITSSNLGGRFGIRSGTSMSAAHVTGAFAVMRTVNPTATVSDIEQSLKANGVPVLDVRC